jgi:adenosylcobinamide kinase/adenosylcobinamide-phosphate guanylyltransferase
MNDRHIDERSGRAQLILVVGGASSGKSAFALKLAGDKARRAFVATAEPLDAEMGERISRHRSSRGPGWDTAEVPLKLQKWFRANETTYDSIVLDCVTLWLSNLQARKVPDSRVPVLVDKLIHAIRMTTARVVVVSNELGGGLVPLDAGARRFRDLAGQVNQQLAKDADEVYLVVSGVPTRLKPTESG